MTFPGMYDSTGAHRQIPGPPLLVSTAAFVYVKSNREHFRLRLVIFDFFFFLPHVLCNSGSKDPGKHGQRSQIDTDVASGLVSPSNN